MTHVFILDECDLLCPDCAEDIRDKGRLGGPWMNGGGEADCPQYCDRCGVFLDNPLTPYGEEYVREKVAEYDETGKGDASVIEEWRSAYNYLWANAQVD